MQTLPCRNAGAHARLTAICLALALLTGSCGAKTTGMPYAPNEALPAAGIRIGTIAHVGQATIEHHPGNNPALVGAAAGALLGYGLLGDMSNPSGLILGAGGGALAGGYGSAGIRRQAALHLTIDLDDGQIIQLVQVEDDVYMPGDRVRILYDKEGKARAQH